MFIQGPNYILRCIREDQVHFIMHACHEEPYGGNYVARRISYKILEARFYKLDMFQYVMNIKGWGSPQRDMRFHYTLKSHLKVFKNRS